MTFRGGPRNVKTTVPPYVRPVVAQIVRHPMVSNAFAAARAVAAAELYKSTGELPPPAPRTCRGCWPGVCPECAAEHSTANAPWPPFGHDRSDW